MPMSSVPNGRDLVRLRALLQPDFSIYRAEAEPPPTGADRALQPPLTETPGDHQRPVGLDVAVHGAELEIVGPVRPAHLGVHRAVHRRRLGETGRGDADAAVHRARPHIALE